ncbi:MAG: hypothetical protein E7544_08920 [Ruminococcaceae bacterium]|nr:hypothetical protein [Oscillospiraceae bacterium]
MNKKKSSGIQFVFGFGVVMLLWGIGLLAIDPFDWFYNIFMESDIDVYLILDIVLTGIPFLICLYLILLSVSGKRNNYKVMYYSALTAVCLPIIAYLFNELPLNDSSIITWILGLTIGWILYPFGLIGLVIFDNVDIGFGYYEGMYIVLIMASAAILSMVLYKTIKIKN